METVLEMELPWRMLRSKLVRCNDAGDVIYDTTFDELEVKHRYSGVKHYS